MKTKTYRIKYDTRNFGENNLQTFLENEFGTVCGITIKSISKDLDDKHMVCTVKFENPPPKLQLESDKKHNIPPSITIDDSFMGLTVLHCPPAAYHKIEYVFFTHRHTFDTHNASQYCFCHWIRWSRSWLLHGEKRRSCVAS